MFQALGLDDSDFVIGRTQEKKPFLEFGPSPGPGAVEAAGGAATNRARAACAKRGFPNFNFNATHHGRVVALACEPTLVVGVDVMNEVGGARSGCRGESCNCRCSLF